MVVHTKYEGVQCNIDLRSNGGTAVVIYLKIGGVHSKPKVGVGTT